MRSRIPVAVIVLGVITAACGRIQIGGSDTQQQMDQALRAVVTGKPPAYVRHDPEGSRLWKQAQAFYEARDYTAAWIDRAKPRPQLPELITAIHEADREGLDPELYAVADLDARTKKASEGFLSARGFDPDEAGSLDVWLTYLYMKYASDLADGLSDLAHADKNWRIRAERFDARAHLEAALEGNRIKASLQELTPQTEEYVRLRAALADHRKQRDAGGWPEVPSMRLKAGQKSPHVTALARRLQASGDYDGSVPPENAPAAYTPELQDAVKSFQRRHGLTDDGVVGPELIRALNVPIERRISEIALNMERWRWLPRDLGERYILVNIPEMQLDIYEGRKVPLSMRVVVGRQDTQTPIFADEMSYLVFSPYWNVPPGIAEGETLPAVMNDPAFLARNNMEMVDNAGNVLDPTTVDLDDPSSFRFRQRPGTSNSLGLVKFMFPNQFNVYLHDTPADSLFERATRSFSHGCVRVEDPVALAEYVLRDQPEWTREEIDAAMHAGTEKTVKLKEKIPVYLGYWTARVRPDGTVHFRGDVYDIDRRQTALLKDRVERLRKTGEAAVTATTPEEKPEGKAGKEKPSPAAKPASGR